MANVNEQTLTNHGSDTTVKNWISQINAGGTTYDIATHHGITFKDGSTGSALTWNGLTDLTVVIPSIADIITNPIRFVGVVNANGKIMDGTTEVTSITGADQKGSLVWIGENCTFGGYTCEAGDMAVWDGTKWYVVSGENQISLLSGDTKVGTTNIVLTGTAKEIINVEGKTLSLSVDYSKVADVLEVTKNTATSLDVVNGIVKVPAKYISLTQGDATSSKIGEVKSVSIPTALADGTVTVNEKVLAKDDFTFAAGKFPTQTKNSTAISISGTAEAAVLTKGTGTDFSHIDAAIKEVKLDGITSALTALNSDNTTGKTKQFVTGIAETATGENADITLLTSVTAAEANNTFATGFGDEKTSGAVVSSVTGSKVEVNTKGTDFLSGLTAGGSSVVIGVSQGAASQDTSKSWFYSDLGTEGTSGDVVSSITTGSASLAADSSSNLATSVMNSAKVENHILSFGTTNVMSPVKVSYTAPAAKYKSFSKSGVSLGNLNVTTDTFKTAGVTYTGPTVKYKDLVTGSVTLTPATTDYTFAKTAETIYTATTETISLTTTNSIITDGSYTAGATKVTASIPKDTVVVGESAGTVPSLTIADTATGTLTASVGTALNKPTETPFNVLTSNTISLPGAYSLAEATESSTGAIEVGTATATGFSVENGQVSIDKDSYVTGVTVNSSTNA